MAVTISASQVLGNAPLRVHFTASGWTSELVGDYEWNFGDGRTATGMDVYHVFVRPGVYTVVFVAKNNLKEQAEYASIEVTVRERFVVAQTDTCFRIGLGIELQGVGPSEFYGENWPCLPVGIGGVECVDKTNQIHQLVFDNRHGAWMEIGMPNGPVGSMLVEKFGDDDVAGVECQIDGSIELPEICGESEHFTIEGLDGYYYFRPVDPDAMQSTDYTRTGMRSGQKILIELFMDGNSIASDRSIAVPTDGKVVFGSAKMGRRGRVKLSFDTSEFVFTGYTQYWTVRDIDVPNGVTR